MLKVALAPRASRRSGTRPRTWFALRSEHIGACAGGEIACWTTLRYDSSQEMLYSLY
jgi:hypothetical protein